MSYKDKWQVTSERWMEALFRWNSNRMLLASWKVKAVEPPCSLLLGLLYPNEDFLLEEGPGVCDWALPPPPGVLILWD